MVRVSNTNPTTRASSSKQLAIIKHPISKIGQSKEKGNVTYFVRVDSTGRHYGCTSTNPKRIILAPSTVSRVDGDLEKETPPHSPNRDTTSVFTRPKPYIVEVLVTFMRAKDSTRYDTLISKGKWPIPLLYPDRGDLHKLDMYDEIRILLSTSGLSFIFKDDPDCYKSMTMEFLCSFNPVVKKDEGDVEIVKCWRFQLGGYVWDIDANVLHDWFRFPRDGVMLEYNDKDVWRFWKTISGEDYRGEIHKSASIRTPHWKLVHKFLGGVIFVRTSYGRLVSRTELQLMMMMRDGKRIDWLGALTRGLVENQKATSKNHGLGGGSFVTWIAMKLHFTFDGLEVAKERLHLKMMRARQILGNGLTWKNPPPDSDEEGVVPMEGSEDEGYTRPADIPSSSTHPPPSSTRPQASSTSSLEHKMDMLLASFGAMAKEQLVLSNYVVDHLKWG